jgi:sodium transport system permease protein
MRAVWTVFRKEMKETLRDRRTLLIMVAVPVLLYPAIMVLAQQLTLFGRRQLESSAARVAVLGSVPEDLLAYLRTNEDLELVAAGDPEAAIRARSVTAVAVVEADGRPEGTREITVFYDGANDRSQRGHAVLVSALSRWSDTLLTRRIEARNLPATFAEPLDVNSESVALPEELGGYALGRFLPMILIIITLLGVFYPAIDLAAGEKERGTLETLLTAPTHARQIVTGKFMTVTAIGMVAAGLNLGSMLLTFQSGLFQIRGAVDVDFSIPISAIVIIFATLVPLAILFGALFLGVAVRSRSFKEAQNALTPFYMAVIIPALLPVFPGIEFTALMSFVPVAGVALMFRELMGGSVPFVLAALTLMTTLAYAMLALLFAADAFGREDVLFGVDDDAPGGELGWIKRLFRPGGQDYTVPTATQTAAFVGGVALLFFYVGMGLQTSLGEQGLLASEWLILLGSAVAFTWAGGFNVKETFSLNRPPALGLLGGVLLIAGGTPMAWFIAWLQGFVLPIPWDLLEGMSEFIIADDLPRVLWLLLLVAVTPAICEEAVFRGVLLGGTRPRMSPLRMILLNGAVFGAFHLSFATAFRFLPTAWLGVLLAYAVWRTRSIYTSALMHLLNNGTIVLLAASPALRQHVAGPDARPPLILLPVALALMISGILILARVGSRLGVDRPPLDVAALEDPVAQARVPIPS